MIPAQCCIFFTQCGVFTTLKKQRESRLSLCLTQSNDRYQIMDLPEVSVMDFQTVALTFWYTETGNGM